MTREMLALTTGQLPRKFTMDVWYGIVGLYIKKTSPINFNEQLNMFDIQSDRLYFTLYELAKFMKLTTGGSNIAKIQDAIRQLKNTQYYSFSNGSIYDKKNEEYIKTKERGLSLILEYEFNSEKKRSSKQDMKYKCWVQLNSLVIDNIKHEFIKYLNSETYFTLPSGLTRGLYTYLEGNKYSSNGMLTYIKRNFEVLANKIPIEYKFNSDLKKKLKKPLENLIKYGIISDYFYGDKYIINKKEPCIYFIFKGKKEDVINILRQKYEEKQLLLEVAADNIKKDEFKMKIPENLDKTLEEVGFNAKVIKQLYAEYDKWDIIKYVIWLQQQKSKNTGSVKNSAGLLRFALMGNVNLDISHKDIVEFVENQKENFEQNKISRQEILKNAYDKYVNDEIEKLKKEEDGTYNIIYENTLINIEAQVDTQIAQLRLLEKMKV
nr:replication initiator protein A [Clostridium botulinum]